MRASIRWPCGINHKTIAIKTKAIRKSKPTTFISKKKKRKIELINTATI